MLLVIQRKQAGKQGNSLLFNKRNGCPPCFLLSKTNAAQLEKTAKIDICKIGSLKEMLDYLF